MIIQFVQEEEFFEGCEKVLDVTFNLENSGVDAGLRAISRSELDMLMRVVKASIISSKSSDTIDSYVLSESSLFVWRDRILLKTCGTTVPLLVLDKLFLIMRKYLKEFQIERVMYSRKCYLQAEHQAYPHKTQQEEMSYLLNIFPRGASHVFNENSEFEWILFFYQREVVREMVSYRMSFGFQVMMWMLDERKAQNFYINENMSFGEMSKKCGIDGLIPCCDLDGFVFDPCGYSMNGLKSDYFQTIHVTPQSNCSYASYESNSSLQNVPELVKKVYSIFLPYRMIISFFCPTSMMEELDQSIEQIGFKSTSIKNVACDGGIIRYTCYDLL